MNDNRSPDEERFYEKDFINLVVVTIAYRLFFLRSGLLDGFFYDVSLANSYTSCQLHCYVFVGTLHNHNMSVYKTMLEKRFHKSRYVAFLSCYCISRGTDSRPRH